MVRLTASADLSSNSVANGDPRRLLLKIPAEATRCGGSAGGDDDTGQQHESSKYEATHGTATLSELGPAPQRHP